MRRVSERLRRIRVKPRGEGVEEDQWARDRATIERWAKAEDADLTNEAQ